MPVLLGIHVPPLEEGKRILEDASGQVSLQHVSLDIRLDGFDLLYEVVTLLSQLRLGGSILHASDRSIPVLLQ